jgi:hypothetical protein
MAGGKCLTILVGVVESSKVLEGVLRVLKLGCRRQRKKFSWGVSLLTVAKMLFRDPRSIADNGLSICKARWCTLCHTKKLSQENIKLANPPAEPQGWEWDAESGYDEEYSMGYQSYGESGKMV